mmetsp:Transcript_4898/g.22135  ORF Transcript_4898/g.22135 Transcript_4898/m.22135 type:complete len:244 (-) Transcript_4898:316-1047(-)
MRTSAPSRLDDRHSMGSTRVLPPVRGLAPPPTGSTDAMRSSSIPRSIAGTAPSPPNRTAPAPVAGIPAPAMPLPSRRASEEREEGRPPAAPPGGGLGTSRPSLSCPRRSPERSTTCSTRGDPGLPPRVPCVDDEIPDEIPPPARDDGIALVLAVCVGIGCATTPIVRAMRSGRRWSRTSTDVRTRDDPRDAPGLLSGMSGRLDVDAWLEGRALASVDARILARSTRLMSSALRSRSLGPVLCG